MSETTKISWCDSTVNFWSGCTKVSAGCANCYAEALSNRFSISPEKPGSLGLWGNGAPRQLHESAFNLAHRLNRKPVICDQCGLAQRGAVSMEEGCEEPHCASRKFHRRRIFSLSLGDWLDPEVPINWLARMLETIRQCNQVTWILCTKRPELFHDQLWDAIAWRHKMFGQDAFVNWGADWWDGEKIPQNIVVLTSVENQEMADKRIPALLQIPAVCRGLSLEPLLGPVKLSNSIGMTTGGMLPGIHWLIIGGESGNGARECDVRWVTSLVKQSRAAGVPVFVKQLGARVTGRYMPDGVNTFQHPNHPKGGDPSEWPADLRVQEFPTAE